LTQFAIGRTDDGKQIGMCLQVYADGTVLDSEGTHHVGREVLKPLIDAIQECQSTRMRSHCGGPPTSFIEQVYVVLYERAYGRLRATSLSYSGSPQGCDQAVRQLHAAIENLQSKLAGASPVSTTSAAPTPATPPAAAPPPPPVATSAPPIPLTAP
jgi:hypothetical protein